MDSWYMGKNQESDPPKWQKVLVARNSQKSETNQDVKQGRNSKQILLFGNCLNANGGCEMAVTARIRLG